MLHVGFRNFIQREKILAITQSDTSPLIQIRKNAEGLAKAINCTKGRKARSLVHLVNGFIAISALDTDTLISRWQDGN